MAAESSLLCSSQRSTSCKTGGRSEPAKQPLRKPKLPVGRFDEPEEFSVEKEPLENLPGCPDLLSALPLSKAGARCLPKNSLMESILSQRRGVDRKALNLHVLETGSEKDVV
ncbi:succinate dehydrogenase assembly factor 4, mitochondrial isoform 1-T1 [Amazona ochrocephala]